MPILMRTALFVPGNRPDRIEKAFNTEADVVIIDLEDAVPISEKELSRSKVREKAAQFSDRMMLVRVNALGSPFIEGDLEEVIVEGVNGIVLPKVEKPDDIYEINGLLCALEGKRGLPDGSILLFPLIESAAGVHRVYDIISSKTKPERIHTVTFGAADYTLDMGMEMTLEGTELFYARSRIAIACRASGIAPPIDTPFMIDLNDIDALIYDAKRAKELGFQGKQVIHPRQIEPCNRIFSPTPEEISRAEKIIQVFEEAEASGTAAVQVEGKFIDYAVVKKSRDILARAAAIDKRGIRG
ncbi:MAG: CoA ester lyase [Deltaproteobacteria bacterium]|nr:MAG: CoA ester lyase [Deltaproteobacteria bacterium]